MKTAKIALAVAALLAVPGCNTFEGVGKDISSLGRGVSHVANETRDALFAPAPQHARVASAGEPCDPAAGELAGGTGLPRCSGVSAAAQ